MNLLYFIVNHWAMFLIGGLGFLGVILKLKKLWRGNLIEWLVDVCAMMEKSFGGGTGYLKLRAAYNEFIATFPVISKLVSFEHFSSFVDEALDELNQMLSVNKAVSALISDRVEESKIVKVEKS